MSTDVLLVVALIVWLFPVAVIVIGSQLAPIEDDERIRKPGDVLLVVCWPLLPLLTLLRRIVS